MTKNLSVKWSSDLKALADDLRDRWRKVCTASGEDPFAKIAVVVNDAATAKWLQQHLLVENPTPQVMLDLDFVMLPEFVNDWLWAVRGKSPRERQASQHPYSRNVLVWRIYRILEQASPEGELADLLKYVNTGGGENAPERRYALASRLAALYDDYLNSRFMMLRKWERGEEQDSPDPEWQVALYRALAAEEPETYAKEYEEALNAKAEEAFEHGFPRYLAAFVFDIPFIPEPTLRLLEKISEALPWPMTFWNFNPKDDWLAETPSQNDVKRELKKALRKHREALEGGGSPAPLDLDSLLFYDSPEERLLGALASGARGLIGTLCDDCGGNVEVPAGDDAFNRLHGMDISVHSAYSRRRELETVRDGLHDFLKKTGAAPHEALVLCADWASYAPIVETVFPPEDDHEGFIPISTESMQGDTPILESFDNLLKFRSNRFEVSAVFALLERPAVRARYGLSDNAVDALHDMVKQANIHWGLDDADVKDILGIPDGAAPESSAPYPFTWRRGLDRLTSELLRGFTDDKTLLDAGDIRRLHPCGHVEEERAESVAALWALVEDLATLRRRTLPKGRRGTAAQLQDTLLNLLKTFYAEDDDSFAEFNELRRAVGSVAESVERALGADAEIAADVFVKAVQETIRRRVPGRRVFLDAVHFAPLNAYTATPHRFIWICGLDGGFPNAEHRPSYDMIGRRPSLFDATSRERDAFALLKATLCAGERLAFSYVGREMRNNERIPPSVLLDNLTDYFKDAGIAYTRHDHPLQGYSPRYFHQAVQPDEALPPTYSRAYEKIEQALAAEREPTQQLTAFQLNDEGVTEIALDDLVAFFSHPNRYLFQRRLRAATPWFEDFNDSECLEAKLSKALTRELALGEGPRDSAALSVETGQAPDMKAAEEAVEGIQEHAMAEDYKIFEKEKTEPRAIELEVAGKAVRLTGTFRTVQQEDGTRRSFAFVDKLAYAKNEILIRHLAANAAYEEGVTTIAFSPLEPPKTSASCLAEAARGELSKLLTLATSPLPPEFPDIVKTMPQDDKLPDDWLEKLKGDK